MIDVYKFMMRCRYLKCNTSVWYNNKREHNTNHFDLFVINKDDNQHVFQSCIGLVNMEPFMANTCLLYTSDAADE